MPPLCPLSFSLMAMTGSLPIFIGIWEAVSINSAQIKEVLPRPFTHDLFIDLCAKFSITLRYLQIDSIDDGVYYAQLVMNSRQQEEYLDCRPSDGIALALRGEIPIFVEESVLATAGQKRQICRTWSIFQRSCRNKKKLFTPFFELGHHIVQVNICSP